MGLATGRKFKVTYNEISKLEKHKMEDIPAWRKLYDTILPKEDFIEMFSAFGLAIALGDVHFDRTKSLNARYPDIETTKLKEAIMKHWSEQ